MKMVSINKLQSVQTVQKKYQWFFIGLKHFFSPFGKAQHVRKDTAGFFINDIMFKWLLFSLLPQNLKKRLKITNPLSPLDILTQETI